MDIKGATFPQSSKIYVPGKMFPELHVGMREVKIDDPQTPVVPVYDTSGPYGDPTADIDVKKGLPKIREGWRSWLKDVPGADDCKTQLDFARKGIITPEMEYVAIRENQRLDQILPEEAASKAITPELIKRVNNKNPLTIEERRFVKNALDDNKSD